MSMIKIYDASTGKEIERKMTDEELAIFEADKASLLEKNAIDEARFALKTSAKAKLIAGQPLTAEEADILVS